MTLWKNRFPALKSETGGTHFNCIPLLDHAETVLVALFDHMQCVTQCFACVVDVVDGLLRMLLLSLFRGGDRTARAILFSLPLMVCSVARRGK